MKRGYRKSFCLRAFCTETSQANIVAFLLALLITLIVLKTSGLSDYLFEEDFKHFKWPPYIDVHRAVVQELLGQQSEAPHYNDWSDYVPLIRPLCRNSDGRGGRRAEGGSHRRHQHSILIIVKTAPYRIEQRRAIRETWGSLRYEQGFHLRTVFVMGLPGALNTVAAHGRVPTDIIDEADRYGDLLVGNFTDHYYNNTLKFVHSIGFARRPCPLQGSGASELEANGEGQVAPYLLLVDDDYLVSPRNLIAEARRHPPNERLYMGWRWAKPAPFRIAMHKHRMTLEEYPYHRYPPFISAGSVLMTSQTVLEFYSAIQYVQLFRFDDVYAGILAHLLGIIVQHSDNFSFYYPPDADKDPIGSANFWRTTVASHSTQPWNSYEQLLAANATTTYMSHPLREDHHHHR